jgi:hypothetical protein
VILAVDREDPWRPELLDFLGRYQPTTVVAVGPLKTPGPQLPGVLVSIDAGSSEALACELARRFFSKPGRAVLCTFTDRASALQAAVLAGRLAVPLLPCTPDGITRQVESALLELGVEQVMAVGADSPRAIEHFRVERFSSAADVAKFLESAGERVKYVAAVNANDGEVPHAKDLSLAAAVLAVGRGGAIAPTPEDVEWKRPVSTESEVIESPPGAHASSKGWRLGTLGEGSSSRDVATGFVTGFVTGFDPATGRAFMQMDMNGNGHFGDGGEGPLFTGSEIEIGGRRFAISLDADEHTRAKSVWLTSPTASEIVDFDREGAGGSFREAGDAVSCRVARHAAHGDHQRHVRDRRGSRVGRSARADGR